MFNRIRSRKSRPSRYPLFFVFRSLSPFSFIQVFSGYLCNQYFRSPVPLVNVFEALRRLGQLDALFAEMSEKMRKEVIVPLLSRPHVPSPKVPNRAYSGRDWVDLFATGTLALFWQPDLSFCVRSTSSFRSLATRERLLQVHPLHANSTQPVN